MSATPNATDSGFMLVIYKTVINGIPQGVVDSLVCATFDQVKQLQAKYPDLPYDLFHQWDLDVPLAIDDQGQCELKALLYV